MPRPISVTVVLWVVIALTLESLLGLFGPFANSFLTPIAAQHGSSVPSVLWSGVGFGVAQVSLALLMFRGIAWARVVYVCVLVFAALGLLLKGGFLYITLVFILKSAIFVYVLFRREANAFFASGASSDNTGAGNTSAA